MSAISIDITEKLLQHTYWFNLKTFEYYETDEKTIISKSEDGVLKFLMYAFKGIN